MTTTLHAIILGLGLLAIWAWLMVSLIKIKTQVVVCDRTSYIFSVETRWLNFIMHCLFSASMGLIMGSVIRIIRGV